MNALIHNLNSEKKNTSRKTHDSFSDTKNTASNEDILYHHSRKLAIDNYTSKMYTSQASVNSRTQESYVLSNLRQPEITKKQKRSHLSPIVIGRITVESRKKKTNTTN